MAGGDAFSAAQRAELDRVVREASAWAGRPIVVYVGGLAEGRASALQLHAQSAQPSRTVLVAVDPGRRKLEIVTGSEAAVWCDARACGLAAATMTTSFSAGDLLGGIRNGVQLLADRAHQPELANLQTL
ncbi:MAG TPA: DUF5130 family protein [Candidatus Nanopelagicales bacterium]|nr:DUF5130 family protein [Candidatus Nanopelagicales bacterium]